MSLFVRASLVALLSLDLTTTVSAADTVRLANLATTAGYTYNWLPTEGGVTLARPGVTIVLHAGYSMYEVNGVPVQSDRSPKYDRGDLVVSAALADRLRGLAVAHPLAAQIGGDAISTRSGAPATSTASGSLTVKMRQIPGREAVQLSGTAPPLVPVTITLTGELSVDIAVVVLNRTTVMSAADGTYSAVASIAENPHRGSPVAATVTSVPGVPPATARIIVNAPSSEINSSLDVFPPK